MKMCQKGSKRGLVWFHPFGLGTRRRLGGAWYEHACGPWGLPLLGTHFQQAEGPSGALRGFLHWTVEGIDKLQYFRLDLDDILALRLHLLLLLLLDGLQLAREVLGIKCVEYGEEEVAVTGWFTVEALVRKVAENVWLLDAVLHYFGVGELFVPWDFDLAELLLFEVELAAVQQGSDEVHGAVARLREVDLAYSKRVGGKMRGNLPLTESMWNRLLLLETLRAN